MLFDLVCLRRLLAFTAMTSQPERVGERTSASGEQVSRNRASGALHLALQLPASASWRPFSVTPLCPSFVSPRVRI